MSNAIKTPLFNWIKLLFPIYFDIKEIDNETEPNQVLKNNQTLMNDNEEYEKAIKQIKEFQTLA
jgi:hypothetical protein